MIRLTGELPEGGYGKMLPEREKARELLEEAERCNPGPWGDHSRVAAYCAEMIARECEGMDPDKAYILGLLHDIGRRFGVRHLGHVSDGYSYMMELGYDEAARVGQHPPGIWLGLSGRPPVLRGQQMVPNSAELCFSWTYVPMMDLYV